MLNAKSRIAGYFQLNDNPKHISHPNINDAILVVYKILKNNVSSTVKVEIAGIFHNAQYIIPIQCILKAISHIQPPMPIKTNNSIVERFVNNNMHQKRSKSWDMHYHWLRDRQAKQQLRIYWNRGVNNHADYFTKYHLKKHYLEIRFL